MWVTTVMRSAIVVASCVLSLSAYALEETPKQVVDIPPGDLGDALKQLARQSGADLVYRPEQVRGVHTQGARGKLSVQEAIGQLLQGTHLTLSTDSTGAMLVSTPLPAVGAAEQISKDVRHPLSLAYSGPADKQQVEEQPQEKQKNGVSEASDSVVMVVTGTNIRGAAPVGSPLTVIGREEIEQSGYTSVIDVIDTLSQNFSGGLNEGSTFANARDGDVILNQANSSSANLRGLGGAATLTLINGNRVAPSGNSSAADLSAIPLSAVERIEVLTDGASAIYGTDAVAGVINIILKQEFRSAETLAEYGSVTRGGYAKVRAGQSLGATWATGSGMLNYEYAQNESLLRSDRNYGYAPGDSALLPESRRNNVLGTFRQVVGEHLEINASAAYAKRDNSGESEFAERVVVYDSETRSAMLGVRTGFGLSWSADLIANYSESDISRTNVLPNQVPLPNKLRRINSTKDLVARFSGDIARMPAGLVKASVGGESRREEFAQGRGFDVSPAGWSRDVNSLYGELNVPLLSRQLGISHGHDLRVSLAVRASDYSDFGRSDDYQAGISWSPHEAVVFRGSHGTSFRAPRLSDIARPGLSGGSSLLQYRNDPQSSTGSTPVLILTGPRPDMGPETSTSSSIGIDFKPPAFQGMKLAVTLFDFDYVDRIDLPSRSTSDYLVLPELFGDYIRRNVTQAELAVALESYPLNFNPSGIDTADVSTILDQRLSNIASARIRGLDLTGSHEWRNGAGRWSISGSVTKSFHQLIKVAADTPESDVIGTVYYPTPFKGRVTGGWQREGLSVSASLNYVTSYSDRAVVPLASVDSFTTVDARVAYQTGSDAPWLFRECSFALAIRNAFNVRAPHVASVTSGYDPSNANPLGTLITASVRKQW